MADTEISALPAATTLAGTEVVPVVQSGATKKATVTQVLAAEATARAAADALLQPLDSDLTAIAALTTTSFGRSLLALADAAAGRTALALGTAATSASTAFDAAGSAAAAQAASQPLDSDLTAIAALTTTAYGRAFLSLADGPALRAVLGTGTADATTFLRGDGTWQVVSGGGGAPTDATYVTLSANGTLTGEFTFSKLSGRGLLAARAALGLGVDHAGATWRVTGADAPLGEYITFWDGSAWSETTRGKNDFSGPQAVGTSYVELSQMGSAPSAGAANTRRTFVDPATGKLSVITSAGTIVSLEEQGGSAAGLLASSATALTSAYTLTTTLADITDGTTIPQVTFTVPASGNVLVTANCLSKLTTAALISFNLREGSTTVGGTDQGAHNLVSQIRTTHKFRITGLTAGSSHTYKLAAKVVSGGAGTIVLTDPITLDVAALP